jgi:hypothetical protein
MIVAGQAINRREIINYVANKLGGVHFDKNRKPDERAFKVLDDHRGKLHLQGIDILYYELLAIGQHLLRSGDISGWLPEGLRLGPSMPGVDETMNWPVVETIAGPINSEEE